MRRWLRLVTLLLPVLACGGTASDAVDATTCDCSLPDPMAETLVTRVPGSLGPGLIPFVTLVMLCPEGVPLSASCEQERLDPGVTMFGAGFANNPSSLDYWGCGWRDRSNRDNTLTTRLICLAPQEEDGGVSGNDACECPEVQPIEERIVRVQQSEFVTSGTAGRLSVECDSGSVLIDGGCALQFPGSDREELTLSRSGFSPTNPNAWECSWNNPSPSDELMIATAICLEPPQYGPDPAEGRIVRISKQETLLGTRSASSSAACDRGDLLIGGSCTIDSTDPLSHLITMWYLGIVGNEPHGRRLRDVRRVALRLEQPDQRHRRDHHHGRVPQTNARVADIAAQSARSAVARHSIAAARLASPGCRPCQHQVTPLPPLPSPSSSSPLAASTIICLINRHQVAEERLLPPGLSAARRWPAAWPKRSHPHSRAARAFRAR